MKTEQIAVMKKVVLFSVFLVFGFQWARAQEHDHSHDHDDKKGHRHLHELGFSVSSSYFLNEKELAPAVHLHYVYNFPHTKFGLGLGYERIFDEHGHNFFGLEIDYRPLHPLTLSLSPGIAYEGGHSDEKEFALHSEAIYEFEFGAFHLGPMIEAAWHPEDFHLSLGIHIGLGL